VIDTAQFFEALTSAEAALEPTDDRHHPMAWRRMVQPSGLLRADLPARLRGAGLGAEAMMPLFAHCGQRALDLRDVPGAGHSRLLLGARNRHFDELLCQVGAGQAYCAIAITEAGAGSDMHGLAATAYPELGGYRLEGQKLFVSRLAEASHALVFAQVRRPHMEARLTVFVVPLESPGLRRLELENTGLRGVSFGGLELGGTKVPLRARVGGEGQGFQLFTQHFTYWRTAMAAAAIGCARGALDQAIHWLRSREAFGGPIGRFTHLQQALAEHVARLHMAWLLVAATARRIDEHQPAYADAAMAKAESLEAAVAAVDWATQIYGARGQTTELDLEQRRRDLQALRIADGTTDVLRGQVARTVLGESLYQSSLGRDPALRGSDGNQGTRRFW
jgi:alkylation response protein AidB-like acyl-CoA dehydrogenase